MKKESVVFNEITFTRYPDSPYRTSRVYYQPYIGSKRAKGIQLLHIEIWKQSNGPVPAGCQVHHKDKNPLNNSLDNLECLTHKQHMAKHRGECSEVKRQHVDNIRPLASDWHRSALGRQWHSEHGRQAWANRKGTSHVCLQCGGTYESLANRDTDRFCSRVCISKFNEATRRYYEDRNCIVCGVVFNVKKSKPQVVCSRTCSWTLRRTVS